MIKNWDGIRNTEKMKRRVYKGIPNSLRGEVWSLILNLKQVREEQQGKYEVRIEI